MSKKRDQRVKQKKTQARRNKQSKRNAIMWDHLAAAAFSQIQIFRKLYLLVSSAVEIKKEKANEELNKRSIAGFYKAINDHMEAVEKLLQAHSKTEVNEKDKTVFVLLPEGQERRPLKDDPTFTTLVDYKRGHVGKNDAFVAFDIFNHYAEEAVGIQGLVELSNTTLELLGYITEEDRNELIKSIQSDFENYESDLLKAQIESNNALMESVKVLKEALEENQEEQNNG